MAVLVFAFALALRAFFVQATPDAAWAYHAAFKGDALVWLDYARALQHDEPFDLGLPIHPPGNAYLVAWLWDGSRAGLARLRWTWLLMGALVPAVVAWSAQRLAGPRAGWLAGLASAVSTGPLLLSASLNNETPYLVLALLSLALLGPLRERAFAGPWAAAWAAWGALQGLACLFRVEHVLAAGLCIAWLAHGLWRDGRRPWLGPALAVGGLLAALTPWQASAWRRVADFNRTPRPVAPAEEAAYRHVEEQVAALQWDPEALARRDALPAFARRPLGLFVAATLARQGIRQVSAAAFDSILDEAFGGAPPRLPERFLVSLYGPLNFALANHANADGGFSPALLEEPPPAAAVPGRFPPELLAGLPPPQLSFVYPPHVALVVHGYARGVDWMARHPAATLRLAWRKLRLFWSGAALGAGGYSVPLGASGWRGAVDLVVPQGGWLATLWRLGLLALLLACLPRAWRHDGARPWLAFAASKLAVALLFFGYARLGASTWPALALVLAVGTRPGRGPGAAQTERRQVRAAWLLAVALLGLEAWRWHRPPSVVLDGRSLQSGDPFPADWHRPQLYEAR